ncbi:MAG: FkbM family methyltransferase, partial [bacterium]
HASLCPRRAWGLFKFDRVWAMPIMKIDFIQIGSNIGNTESDIIWKIIRRNNWKGIFVEPIRESFELLKKNYSDWDGNYFENVAVMDYNGEINIYTRSDGIYNRQQASIKKDHWQGKNDLSVRVQCLKLNSLIEKYKLSDIPFELLQIDAEGSDYSIIMGTDFSHIIPEFIRFESCHMTKRELSAALRHLKNFGYIKIKDQYEHLCIEGEKGIDVMVKKSYVQKYGYGSIVADWIRTRILK